MDSSSESAIGEESKRESSLSEVERAAKRMLEKFQEMLDNVMSGEAKEAGIFVKEFERMKGEIAKRADELKKEAEE